MSQSENSNNKLPLPTSPKDTTKYIRHPKYYFEDGGTVFLAGGVLFKLPASLLKADSGAVGYRFEEIMKDRLNDSNSPHDKLGTSDLNPIVLPVGATIFYRFLLVILGRIGDPVYTSIFTAAQDPKYHRPNVLAYYLEVGMLASYFGMKNLESWVHSQIRILLQSEEALAAQKWSGEDLTRLFTYLQTGDMPNFQHELLTLIQLILCPQNTPLSCIPDENNSNLLVYAKVYKSPHLATLNPALFGALFAVILSFDHRSSVWTELLTRDDRTVLYAARADLTNLRDSKCLELSWLLQPSRVKEVCLQADCLQKFNRAWSKSFARCKRLDSLVPLEDINCILTLPRYRLEFSKQCQGWSCHSGCAQKSLNGIDAAIRRVFCGLAKNHDFWAKAL